MSHDEGASERPPLEDAHVLVVEDEESLASLYRVWLEPDFEVTTALTGRAAEAALDATVDVVVLDRRLPDATGREVLERIREGDHDCMVTMASAVEPGLDIAGLPIDDYLPKPVDRGTLRATIEELLLRATVPESRRELLALHSRRLVLETEFAPSQLEDAREYRGLLEAIGRLESALEDPTGARSSADRPATCPACGRRWTADDDGAAGYVPVGPGAWKCRECGRVVGAPDAPWRSATSGG